MEDNENCKTVLTNFKNFLLHTTGSMSHSWLNAVQICKDVGTQHHVNVSYLACTIYGGLWIFSYFTGYLFDEI